MPASDAAIVARWKLKLKIRQGLLARARKQLATREKQVADARAVIARHDTPPLRERAFAEAVKSLGVREVGGNNQGREVEKLQAEGGGKKGDAWCGWAVAAWYRRAGSKIHDWQLGAVRLMDRAGLLRVRKPKRGHVVRFTFSHTGLFDEWIPGRPGWFRTIEGNTRGTGAASDAGGGEGVHRRERHTDQVTDFLRFPR